MDTVKIKETIVMGRELIIKLADALSKILPFEGSKIAGVIVLILCFWIANSLISIFPNLKNNFLIKLIGTGAIFYFLWLW